MSYTHSNRYSREYDYNDSTDGEDDNDDDDDYHRTGRDIQVLYDDISSSDGDDDIDGDRLSYHDSQTNRRHVPHRSHGPRGLLQSPTNTDANDHWKVMSERQSTLNARQHHRGASNRYSPREQASYRQRQSPPSRSYGRETASPHPSPHHISHAHPGHPGHLKHPTYATADSAASNFSNNYPQYNDGQQQQNVHPAYYYQHNHPRNVQAGPIPFDADYRDPHPQQQLIKHGVSPVVGHREHVAQRQIRQHANSVEGQPPGRKDKVYQKTVVDPHTGVSYHQYRQRLPDPDIKRTKGLETEASRQRDMENRRKRNPRLNLLQTGGIHYEGEPNAGSRPEIPARTPIHNLEGDVMPFETRATMDYARSRLRRGVEEEISKNLDGIYLPQITKADQDRPLKGHEIIPDRTRLITLPGTHHIQEETQEYLAERLRRVGAFPYTDSLHLNSSGKRFLPTTVDQKQIYNVGQTQAYTDAHAPRVDSENQGFSMGHGGHHLSAVDAAPIPLDIYEQCSVADQVHAKAGSYLQGAHADAATRSTLGRTSHNHVMQGYAPNRERDSDHIHSQRGLDMLSDENIFRGYHVDLQVPNTGINIDTMIDAARTAHQDTEEHQSSASETRRLQSEALKASAGANTSRDGLQSHSIKQESLAKGYVASRANPDGSLPQGMEHKEQRLEEPVRKEVRQDEFRAGPRKDLSAMEAVKYQEERVTPLDNVHEARPQRQEYTTQHTAESRKETQPIPSESMQGQQVMRSSMGQHKTEVQYGTAMRSIRTNKDDAIRAGASTATGGTLFDETIHGVKQQEKAVIAQRKIDQMALVGNPNRPDVHSKRAHTTTVGSKAHRVIQEEREREMQLHDHTSMESRRTEQEVGASRHFDDRVRRQLQQRPNTGKNEVMVASVQSRVAGNASNIFIPPPPRQNASRHQSVTAGVRQRAADKLLRSRQESSIPASVPRALYVRRSSW